MEHFILETKNICKQFGKQKAVDMVSLQVKEGCVYGLLGPNGAGKSTILKMMTGMMKPTQGAILMNGKLWERKMLGCIGALIESPPLYENLSARENLKVRTIVLGLPETRIDEVLDIVGLPDIGKKKAGQFSLGMKQRLGIAAALLNHPKLLILDEPTNGLDPFGIQDMRKLVRSFAEQGITVIISSHILSEVAHMADQVGILVGGKIKYQGEMPKDKDLERLFVDVAGKEEGGY